ncbi:hypothetical protein FA224_21485 [Pseudomonas aeruginosa]|uniref:hypothetical protein n=1 Tax=Pseudomonas aeruginosa TaxID=287 RepID=UPI001E4DE278|nr:hypothetical protein [Pseudomonas aeruginosa]MCD2928282.1 hypothetical protein [Pseudomonas aeruginosa]MCO2586694.1 hypothetical protein [Pseudomonas aeruginosa]MCO2914361.1 hypothetical protein [Pseudomonas aeruginosa]MCO3179471.1 hypothetical protein [Pseudomonas aeruginosa]HBO0901884.1 hypothetical protein [Pseudomonas aeruginosa]
MMMKPSSPRQHWVSAIFHRDFPRRKSLKITMETDPEVRKENGRFFLLADTPESRTATGFQPFSIVIFPRNAIHDGKWQCPKNGTSCRTAI